MAGIALPVIAASTALLSVGMLRYAWRRPSRRHAAVLGGWATAAVSLMLYSSARGAEVGVPFAVAVFSLGGIAAVLANIEIRAPKKMRSRERSTPPADSRSSPLSVVLRTLTVGVLTALTVLGFGLACVKSFTLPGTNVLLFTGFAMLAVWAVLIVWASTDPRIVRVTVIFAVLAALANLLAHWLPLNA